MRRSWDIEVEITRSKPAAVERAAAKPPATISPITHGGKLAISGFARTIISLSIVNSLICSSATYWITPSAFLSSNWSKPVFSQFLNHWGTSEYWAFDTVLIKLTFANAATAGAVVYKNEINNNAHPADILASLTLGTVKNLTITWGSPAVPNINAAVIKNTLINVVWLISVYFSKPKSTDNWLSFSKRYTPSVVLLPNPIWGIGFPVAWSDIKIAGTVKAKIRTQYWATWVYVIPFIPPRTA